MAEIIEVGLDPTDLDCVERRPKLLQGLVAVRAGCNDLRQHRIVERRDLRSAFDPSIDARVFGPGHLRQDTRTRAEIATGIFGVEARLNRSAIRLDAVLVKRRHLTRRLPHHPFNEIDAGDLFRHAVLDLEARVDLKEVESVSLGIVEIFDGARAFVFDRLTEAARRLPKGRASLVGQVRRGRLLDDLLVTPLRRAIAFAERNDVPLAVAEDLHLDMPAARDIFLEEQAWVLEVVAREPLDALIHRHEIARRGGELQADPAPSRRALDHHRIGDAGRLAYRVPDVADEARSRHHRHAGKLRKLARFML